MKNILLVTAVFFILPVSSVSQVPYQGIVTKLILPLISIEKQDSVIVSYHASFDGKLCIHANDNLIIETIVKKDQKKTLYRAGTILNGDHVILKIVLNDKFYLNEIVEFHHPYIRILYEPEHNNLTISCSNISPVDH